MQVETDSAADMRLESPPRLRIDPFEPDAHVELERAGVQVVGEPTDRADVRDMDGSRGEQEDRPRDPAVPPLVLILDVARVGPFDHRQSDGVVARLDDIRHVEFGGEM